MSKTGKNGYNVLFTVIDSHFVVITRKYKYIINKSRVKHRSGERTEILLKIFYFIYKTNSLSNERCFAFDFSVSKQKDIKVFSICVRI